MRKLIQVLLLSGCYNTASSRQLNPTWQLNASRFAGLYTVANLVGLFALSRVLIRKNGSCLNNVEHGLIVARPRASRIKYSGANSCHTVGPHMAGSRWL